MILFTKRSLTIEGAGGILIIRKSQLINLKKNISYRETTTKDTERKAV